MVQKACKNCKFIHEGNQCPKCGSDEASENFKGRLIVIDPERSEIAQRLKIKDKGVYAFKIG